jgi:hypothetical protein
MQAQRSWMMIGVALCVMSLTMACGGKPESPTTTQTPTTPQTPSSTPTQQPVTSDLSTPEGPLQVIFQAAKAKNYELYRSAYSDTVPPEVLSQKRFQRFTQRIVEDSLEIIPGFEKISDTEAIVKWKNKKKNKDRGVRVRKVGDRWLIVGMLGESKRKKGQQGETDL